MRGLLPADPQAYDPVRIADVALRNPGASSTISSTVVYAVQLQLEERIAEWTPPGEEGYPIEYEDIQM